MTDTITTFSCAICGEPIDVYDTIPIPSDDLETTSDDLETTSDDLGTTSDDLGTTSDDLGTTSDDLGTTSDDLETTSDDLETTSDDLETTSDDLETTSDDLETTFDDLETTSDALGITSDDLERGTCHNCRSAKGKIADLDIAIRASGDNSKRIEDWPAIRHSLRKQYGQYHSEGELWERCTDWLRAKDGLERNDYLSQPLNNLQLLLEHGFTRPDQQPVNQKLEALRTFQRELPPSSSTGFIGGVALAVALRIHTTRRDAFLRQLARHRFRLRDDCWHEVREPRSHSPRFLYRVDSPELRTLAAKYTNPTSA